MNRPESKLAKSVKILIEIDRVLSAEEVSVLEKAA